MNRPMPQFGANLVIKRSSLLQIAGAYRDVTDHDFSPSEHSGMIGFAAGRLSAQADRECGKIIGQIVLGMGRRMDRRDFIAGCASLSLAVGAVDALGQPRPLTRCVMPFSASRSGDTLGR